MRVRDEIRQLVCMELCSESIWYFHKDAKSSQFIKDVDVYQKLMFLETCGY